MNGTPGEAMAAAIVAEMQESGLVPDAKEAALIETAARLMDRLDALEHIIERDGELVAGPGGSVRVHPAVAEHRQQAVALARVLGGVAVTEAGQGKNPVKQRAANRRWDLAAERAARVM